MFIPQITNNIESPGAKAASGELELFLWVPGDLWMPGTEGVRLSLTCYAQGEVGRSQILVPM